MHSPVRLVVALALFLVSLALASLFGAATWQLLVIAAAVIAGAFILFGGEAEANGRQIVIEEKPAAKAPEPISTRAWLMHTDFQRLIAQQDSPILVVGDGLVLSANPPALSLLGHHIIGQDIRTAIRHPAAADRLANPRADSSGSITDLVGLGGTKQRWQMRTIALGGGERFVLLNDLSALESAERMRTDFVANASHELRTPLAAILGFIETLRDPDAGEDAPTRERFLGVMDKEAKRMRQLVDDLISLSRIEADRYRTPSDRVDFAQLVREVAHDIQESGNRSNSVIATTIADDMPKVTGDRTQLAQLLHNIIGNAAKYNREGRAIAITLGSDAEAATNMVKLTVRDEGEGIEADHIPRLTERFYRVDSARSRAMGGTGLGLSIVKHIVERHKGRLAIDSAPGVGTNVTIWLPAWLPVTEKVD